MNYYLLMLCMCCCLALGAQEYDMVLQTDFDGSVTQGSKEELISSIQKGNPVRVGWQLDFDDDQLPDLEHWVDATFITILGGEVFTQIEAIYAQGPNLEIPQIQIFPNNTKWTAVLGTNGLLLNRFIQNEADIPALVFDDSLNLSTEEKNQMREQEQLRLKTMKQVNTWHVSTSWAVLR